MEAYTLTNETALALLDELKKHPYLSQHDEGFIIERALTKYAHRKRDELELSKNKRFIVRRLVTRQKFKCFYCPSKLTLRRSTVDHKVPLALDGAMNDLENMVAACQRCNNEKGDMTTEEFMTYLKLRDEYNEKVSHPKNSTPPKDALKTLRERAIAETHYPEGKVPAEAEFRVLGEGVGIAPDLPQESLALPFPD